MATEASSAATTTSAAKDVVTVTLPASGAYLAVLRTATAGLASRLDFTLDDIEDLRIAVDEACVMLLTQAVPGAEIRCEFTLDGGVIRVAVSVFTSDDEPPSHDTFAWTVLSALADTVESEIDADKRVTVTLTKQRAGGTT